MNTGCMIALSLLGSITFLTGYAVIRYGWPRSRMQINSELQQLRTDIKNLRAVLDALAEQNATIRTRMQVLEVDRQNMEITLARLRGEMGRVQ